MFLKEKLCLFNSPCFPVNTSNYSNPTPLATHGGKWSNSSFKGISFCRGELLRMGTGRSAFGKLWRKRLEFRPKSGASPTCARLIKEQRFWENRKNWAERGITYMSGDMQTHNNKNMRRNRGKHRERERLWEGIFLTFLLPNQVPIGLHFQSLDIQDIVLVSEKEPSFNWVIFREILSLTIKEPRLKYIQL